MDFQDNSDLICGPLFCKYSFDSIKIQVEIMKAFLANVQTIVILSVIISTLTGCSKQAEEESESTITSTFFVSKIEGNSSINNVDPTFQLPTSKLYNFKVCLKDIMQTKAIIGQPFDVSDQEKNIRVFSDDEGCLNWGEDFEYSFISQSSFVKITKNITAAGVHKGKTTIVMAINPWSHGENQTRVIDVSKEAVVTSITVNQLKLNSNALQSLAVLKIIEPRITITEREFNSSGASMMLKFQNKIGIDLLNTSSQKVQHILNSGNFKIEISLFNSFIENGKEIIIPLMSAQSDNKTLLQDYLVTETQFTLRSLPTKGQLLLGIKILAADNNLGLGSAESVYLVSEAASIKLDKSPSILGSMTLNELNQNLPKNETVKTDESKNKTDLTRPGVEVDRLDMRFLRIGQETTTTRQVFFTVKACLKNNLDAKALRDLPLVITTYSGKTISDLKTNQDGCVIWDDSVWHKFFGQQQYLKGTITIKNNSYNLNSKINVSINPWVNGLNLGRDARFDNDLGTANITSSSSSSKIIIEDYTFNTTSYGYEINNNLELSMVKKGRMTIGARIINPSSTNEGREKNDYLRSGKYLLKWAVVTVDHDENAKSIISSGEKVVEAIAGDIKSDLAFKISAFKFLNDRSRIVLAIYTIDESKLKNNPSNLNSLINKNSGLISMPYVSTIVLNSDDEREKTWSLDHQMGLASKDVFDGFAKLDKSVNATKDLAALSSRNERQVLQSQGLEKIELNQNKGASDFIIKLDAKEDFGQSSALVNTQGLSDMVKTGRLNQELGSRFCNFWFKEHLKKMITENKTMNRNIEFELDSLLRDCQLTIRKNPELFFAMDKKLVTKKIGNVSFKGGQTFNVSVGNSFYMSKADSKTVSKTWSWSSSLGLKLEFLNIFSFGSQAGYSLARANATSESSTNSSAINISTNMLLQRNTFSLEVLAYNQCLAIKLNPELFAGSQARYKNFFSTVLDHAERARIMTSGYFLCTDLNQKPIKIDESYHLVSQDRMYSSGMIDAHDLANHQLFMSFRGQRDLNSFLSLVQGTVQTEKGNTSSGQNIQSREKLGEAFMKGVPSWPGVYSEI